jgi:probable F420-dependent oxidoreductase
MELGLAPVQSTPTFEPMLRQARTAEALGFSTLWAHEHHSQGAMYPDPLMALAAMAPVTSTVRLGTNMLLLPIHHPVRVAQETAMLDVLSGGRLVLGVANGYSRVDFATFGTDRTRRGARLEAGIELVRELWSGRPVTAVSEDYRLDGFRLFPTPVQRPSPPIVVGGQAPRAIRRAARLGDGYLISTTETIANVAVRIATYREACTSLGLEAPAPILNRIVATVGSRAEREEALAFFTRALLSLYDAWGHANVAELSPDQREPEQVARDHLVVGEPAECLERLQEYEEMGVGQVACLMGFGGRDPALADRSLRLCGERVLPHLAT